MAQEGIRLILENFGFAMFVLAILISIVHKLIVKNRVATGEIVFRWLSLLALGFTGIYTFILHAFFPDISAANIGWQPSPFQYEVAMADLTMGVLGVLAFKASQGFRLATLIASICWLWGDATGHIYQMVKFQNYAVGNAGSWFWYDILVPIFLLIAFLNTRKTK